MALITNFETMKDRIRQIMESMHMNQQVFAQFLEMSPASLSSIFNDRTQPTLNTVMGIKKKIPNINTDWLLSGTGEMFVTGSAAEKPQMTPPSGGESHVVESVLDFQDLEPSPTPSQKRTSTALFTNSVNNTRSEVRREEVKLVDKPQRRVVEIRVFYDDQTWESFAPSKK